MPAKLLITLAGLVIAWGAPLAVAAGSAPGAQLGTANPEPTADLAGTRWRLVTIMSMDDSEYRPDKGQQYTVEFGQPGDVQVVTDCGEGQGAWHSENPPKLQFAPIEADFANCPSDSLSRKLLDQFSWVRSYVLRDGHLFLATVADGSILEFEPLAASAPIATVLGEPIRTTDTAALQSAILTPLLSQYATEQNIVVADDEVEAFVTMLEHGLEREGLTAQNQLNAQEAAEVSTTRHQMARSIIQQWKVNRALYAQYGGRIIYQQFGPEPLDAYRRFLQQQQRNGKFSIADPDMATSFWRYFSDESIHSFYTGDTDPEELFRIPPWAL